MVRGTLAKGRWSGQRGLGRNRLLRPNDDVGSTPCRTEVHMRRSIPAVLFLALASCASTQLVSSWSDPRASALSLDKVLVVAQTGDEATRRLAEDQLAYGLDVGRAIPSHQVLTSEEVGDLSA